MSNTNLAANLSADTANFPTTYEAARKALEECDRIDECKSWADKAAALASYARQSQDRTLHRLALRIQERATRRIGELLKHIPSAKGANLTVAGRAGALPSLVSRTQAAQDAGLSAHQAKQAMRTANIPAAEFEAAVESDNPPTVTELAARGTVSRSVPPTSAPVPADPRQVAEATALLRQFATLCGTSDPSRIACSPGVDADLVRGYVSTIDRWLDKFVTALPTDEAA